ncbi:MAG TPA: lytic murein transglycosylase, partial [Bradyrhizobium sp.]|nr:lytic murein transglycosylase [Bradyrhizobium sp.]
MKRLKSATVVRAGALVLAAALLSPAKAVAQSQGDGVSNFLNNLFAPKSGNNAQAPQGTGSTGPLPWSGEDGASGHPLMTASAIREAAANFDPCVAGMWPDAARRGISQENFQRFTAGLQPDLRIMDLMDSQPEFTKAIWEYLDILVNDARMAKGREILAKYKAEFDAVEKAYGVDRYIIASIWGIESNYSTQIGDRSVLQSTATLACIGRRQKYFRD